MRSILALTVALFLFPALAYADPGNGPVSTKDLAAENINAEEQRHSAVSFLYGINGTPQDYSKAFKLFDMSAEQGNADAQESLGMMYEYGLGVAKNSIEALKWYRKAADQGNDHAQGLLSEMYYYGEGVQQDYAEAYFWHLLASQSTVGNFSTAGMHLTAEQVESAEGRARKWRAQSVVAPPKQ